MYNAKFLWVFHFVNFVNFQPFAKIFQQTFLTRGVQCAHVQQIISMKSSKITL